MTLRSEFQCLKCDHQWSGPFKETGGPGNRCPKCKNAYIRWLNAKEILEHVHAPRKYDFNYPEDMEIIREDPQ